MSRSPSSAYFAKLQDDGVLLADIIELETNGPSFFWTTANHGIVYTLSGTAQEYSPFPGEGLTGLKEDLSLGVNALAFVIINSGSLLSALLTANDFDSAEVKIGRIFTDTPDLGRMEIFQGRLGNLSYDRDAIATQARAKFSQAKNRWPYYNYQDNCIWRFGSSGCGVDTTSFTFTTATDSWDTGSCTTINLLAGSGTFQQSFSAGQLDFGRLTVTDGVNSGHVRTIRAHTGDLLFLSHPLPVNSFANFAADIYPGCRKRRIADCHSLYNNVTSGFVGFEWIPIQEDAY